MRDRMIRCSALLLSLLVILDTGLSLAADQRTPSTLEMGAQAPDFCLPGVDDRQHCLKDYASSKVLGGCFHL